MSSGARVVGVRVPVDGAVNRVRDAVHVQSAATAVPVLAVGVVYGLQVWRLVAVAAAAPSGGSLVGALGAAAGCALLWPIARTLGLAAVAATAAVLLGGAGAILVGVSGPAAGTAVFFLALAGALACASGRLRLAAIPVALLGTLAAPVAAVALLVLGAHLVATSAVGTTWPAPARWTVCATALLGALGTAVLATGDRPWAVASTTPSRLASLIVVGFVVAAAAAWWRPRWLRPVSGATLALCGCALVPGTTGSALLLAAPAAALLAAATLDERLREPPGRALAVALGVGLVLLVTVPALLADEPVGTRPAAAPGTPPAGPAVTDGPARATVGWLGSELDPGYPVAADPATGARLLEQGFPPERVVPLDPEPVGPHVLVLPSGAPGLPEPVETRVGSALVVRLGDGTGSALQVRRPLPSPAQVERAGDERARFGEALSTNPQLDLTPDGRQLLRDGAVDPRLLVLLAGLAGSYPIEVAELPPGPGATGDEPRRSAVITAVDGAPTRDPVVADVLRRWLGAQGPPYAPEVVDRPGEPVTLEFRAPSPLRLPAG